MDRKTLEGVGIGLLVGAVTGGVFALLYAPKSGKETSGVMDTVEDAASEASRKGQAAVKALKS